MKTDCKAETNRDGLLQRAEEVRRTVAFQSPVEGGAPRPQNEGNPAREGSVFICNVRLVDRDIDTPGSVLVCDGKIEEVYENGNAEVAEKTARRARDSGIPVVNGGGKTLTPAFTDMHAHFREPGFSAKETLETAARAAAAGGYTAAVLMANTHPVVSTRDEAEAINSRVAATGLIRSFQAISLTRGFDGKDTSHLDNADSSATPVASEDGRDVESSEVMRDAMEKCAAKGIVVSCHCEDPFLSVPANALRRNGEFKKAEKRFRLAEDICTERNLLLAEDTGCRIHIAHVSTEGALDAVRRAKKKRGGGVTCEATPHHLCLTDETEETVNPPLRPEKDRCALLEGLHDGTIDVIATDHAPHTEEDKKAGAPGFSGLQTAFAVCYTHLVKTGLITISRLSSLMAANPAAILSLPWGLLKTGYDANLALIDIETPFRLDTRSQSWFSKGRNNPFDGKKLYGQVVSVWKNGKRVFTAHEEAGGSEPSDDTAAPFRERT